MRINGRKLDGVRLYEFILPVQGEEPFVFHFRPLTSKDNFEAVMPRPKPPMGMRPGGQQVANVEDPNYKRAIQEWFLAYTNWQFLTSISATLGLEWETVDMADPNTWPNWKEELESNFGTAQVNAIFQAFLEANSLDDAKLDEARQSFLASRAAQSGS